VIGGVGYQRVKETAEVREGPDRWVPPVSGEKEKK
jgi:hypothetical protein